MEQKHQQRPEETPSKVRLRKEAGTALLYTERVGTKTFMLNYNVLETIVEADIFETMERVVRERVKGRWRPNLSTKGGGRTPAEVEGFKQKFKGFLKISF